MANDFSDLLGRIASPFYEGRDLDEEERRRIEELRAQGVYVPQERRIAPFGYGSGRRRREDLTAIRKVLQPEQQRKMSELMYQRGERERQRAATEQFNRRQEFAGKMRAEQERVGAGKVAELNALEAKQRHAIKGTGDPNDPWVRADKDRLDYLKQQRLPTGIQEQTLKQQQQATERGVREAPTHAAQQEQAQAVAKLGTTVTNQELEVAKALNSYQVNGQAYTTILADLKGSSAELANRLNQIKLDVQNSDYGKALMAKVARGELQKADATLEQELMSITAFTQWLMSPGGLDFQSRGGTQGLELDLKLAQVKELLERAKASTARARSYGGGLSNLNNALTNPGGSGNSDYIGPAPWMPNTNTPGWVD